MLAFHIMFVILLTSFSLLLPSPVSYTCTCNMYNLLDSDFNCLFLITLIGKAYFNSTEMTANSADDNKNYTNGSFLPHTGQYPCGKRICNHISLHNYI